MRLPDTFALNYTGGRWLALGGQSASDRMTRRRPAPSAQHPGPGKRRSTAPPLTLAEGRAGGPCRATKLTARGRHPQIGLRVFVPTPRQYRGAVYLAGCNGSRQ